MTNGNAGARRDVHEHVFGLHEALDRLEADDTLECMDYLLDGADTLLHSAVERFEQLRHCLREYGRPTTPSIPLTELEGPRS